jgi:hypothetical protein
MCLSTPDTCDIGAVLAAAATLPSLQYNTLLLEVKFISIVKPANKTKHFVALFDLQCLVRSVTHDAV